jgi:hypothetical protein
MKAPTKYTHVRITAELNGTVRTKTYTAKEWAAWRGERSNNVACQTFGSGMGGGLHTAAYTMEWLTAKGWEHVMSGGC